MKSCNNCTALGNECMVEQNDRIHAAQNCDCYESKYEKPQRRPGESELSYQIRLSDYWERQGIYD